MPAGTRRERAFASNFYLKMCGDGTVKSFRKGSFPAGTGGHLTFNLSGPNARVNFGSLDQSQNVVASDSAFVELRDKIHSSLLDSEERSRL